MSKPKNYMIFHCAHCGLQRQYPSRTPGQFVLQYCWEGECAPKHVLEAVGPLKVEPSVQRRPPIVQDRTRHASNRT